jgi:predicted nucleic acid-binding protein
VIVLDTPVLIEALGAGGSMRAPFRRAIAEGNRIVLPALVLHEWLRGLRVPEELTAQETVVPSADAIPFGLEEARLAAAVLLRLPERFCRLDPRPRRIGDGAEKTGYGPN